ncbi:hypothetical protein Bca4012_010124 [Brassica carinata]
MSSHRCYTKSNQISPGFVITNASSQVSGSREYPGDDILGAGAVKNNPTDGYIIGSPEKTAEGGAAGMLDGSAVEPALPPVEPVSGGSQQLRINR